VEALIIHIPAGTSVPKARQSCQASDKNYTYNMFIPYILRKSTHPEDGSTFLLVLATRSYASRGTHHPIKVARTGASLFGQLLSQRTNLAKVMSALKEAVRDDETEAASDSVARCDRAIDRAYHDLEEVQEQMQFVLTDVSALLSPPETSDLRLTLTILTKCLTDWLELDEGCTCSSNTSELCLTCSSNRALAQARRWLERLAVKAPAEECVENDTLKNRE
jgi:hypothetical protein